jgi:DNA-binding CsgD family transcriptional regulator
MRNIARATGLASPAGRVQRFKGLEALPVRGAVLDANGVIVGVNEAWKQFARKSGLQTPDFDVGRNYFDYCTVDLGNAPRLAQDLKDLIAGRLDLLTCTYPCHSPTRRAWFFLIGVPLSSIKPSNVALLHIDMSALLPPDLADPKFGSGAGPENGSRPNHDINVDMDKIVAALDETIVRALSSQLHAMVPQAAASTPSPDGPRRSFREEIEAQLTRRQRQVLDLLGEGKSNREIAQALGASPNTVKLHVSAILDRLELRSRTQAALLAMKMREPAA